MKKQTSNILSAFFLFLILWAGLPSAMADETETVSTTEFNLESETDFAILDNSVQKAVLQTKPETGMGWEAGSLETYSIQFIIRGKEALTWVLNIQDSGFHNPAIEASQAKALTIANSLFILGMLAIAGMWMFSIFIPRKRLKKVILAYSAAVIFVNFALPLNQLFIDGTEILQRTLLMDENGSIKINDIVQTPSYKEAVGYRKKADDPSLSTESKNTFQVETSEATETGEVTVSTISTPERTLIGSVGASQLTLNLPAMNDQKINLNSQEPFTIYKQSPFNPNLENRVFTFVIMMLSGLAYFSIALIFVLRIVILWGLLILSPLLLLLAIFQSTRGWFINWVGLYGRWLLIGPLIALGLSLVINIWKVSGLPIQANPISDQVFVEERISNIAFYLPGKSTPNTLKNTTEMMEYIVFLIMLYLPIFFSFSLTRQKTFNAIGNVVVEKIRGGGRSDLQPMMIQENNHQSDEPHRTGVINEFKNKLSDKIAQITELAMPSSEKKNRVLIKPMPSASNFLPHELKTAPLEGLLQLISDVKGDPHSKKHVLKQLAMPERIQDRNEREKVTMIYREITERAKNGSQEATITLNEIHDTRSKEIRMEQNRIMENKATKEPQAEMKTTPSESLKAAKNIPSKDILLNEEKMDEDKKDNKTPSVNPKP